jgi:GTP:adenosylcobinamide-phosphate guanylyltransferase
MIPKTAMIFAAGFGTRMAPLTDRTPKPLIEVDGKPLIDHALSLLDGFQNIVVNTHYLADQIETHLAGKTHVTCLQEVPEILETGGGLKNALPLLGPDPVVVTNSDAVFAGPNPVSELLARWKPDHMDALLSLVPIEQTIAHEGAGDFSCDGDGAFLLRIRWLCGIIIRKTCCGCQILKASGVSDSLIIRTRFWVIRLMILCPCLKMPAAIPARICKARCLIITSLNPALIVKLSRPRIARWECREISRSSEFSQGSVCGMENRFTLNTCPASGIICSGISAILH